MDFLIRGMEESLHAEINELAKKENISKNQFIKNFLSMVSYDVVIENEIRNLEKITNKVNHAVEITNARLQRLEKNFDKLYLLMILASGVEPLEIEKLLRSKYKF